MFAAIRATNEFWGKSETIMSTRQYRPEGQNPIAPGGSSTNAAQAWLQWDSAPLQKAQDAADLVRIIYARSPQNRDQRQQIFHHPN